MFIYNVRRLFVAIFYIHAFMFGMLITDYKNALG